MKNLLHGFDSILNAWPDDAPSGRVGTAEELTARAWELAGETLQQAMDSLTVSIPVTMDAFPQYQLVLLAPNSAVNEDRHHAGRIAAEAFPIHTGTD